MSQNSVKMLDVVALLVDLPEGNLRRGQVGTVVEVLAEGVFLVEFADKEGQTVALVDVSSADLLVLYHEPPSGVAEKLPA